MLEMWSGGRRCSAPAPPGAVAVDVLLLFALIGAGWLLNGAPEDAYLGRSVDGISLTVGVVAALVLLTAAALASDRRAARIACAIGLQAVIAVLGQSEGERGRVWSLLGAVATLGVAGFLVLAAGRAADGARGRTVALTAFGTVLLGMGAVAMAGALLPRWVPDAALISAADLVGWSAVGAAAVLLVVTGVAVDRPLPRRAGLAFGVLAVAHGITGALTGDPVGSFRSSFTLGSIVMFLVAAGWFLVATVRAMARQHAASHLRLAEAEAIMAGLAERDHELRNLVAGLSGAAKVLTSSDAGGAGGRDLLAAAGAEFERLKRMLDGRPATPRRAAAAVGPLLRDLALVHRANGLDVRVQVDGDPCIGVEDGVLTQVLANLLANCAQHAPGASVSVHAAARGSRVRIEVVDDGPGLPAGSTAQLLRRGVRGPASTGAGLGLAICTDLVESHRGTFTVVSTAAGCTAVLEFPAARRVASAQAVNA